jgi:hypothetical protein
VLIGFTRALVLVGVVGVFTVPFAEVLVKLVAPFVAPFSIVVVVVAALLVAPVGIGAIVLAELPRPPVGIIGIVMRLAGTQAFQLFQPCLQNRNLQLRRFKRPSAAIKR